ncbi:MAG: hypothetical protein K2Q18_08685 [Bdellovibrionales bacterium]|nr:hypothetical protein [Bdellovibrionales bacterium]
MKLKAILIFSSLLFSITTLASPLPCTIWQTRVKAHPVKPYKNKNGTLIIKKGDTDEHCKLKYPKIEKWQTQFFDGAIPEWPISPSLLHVSMMICGLIGERCKTSFQRQFKIGTLFF